MMICLFQVHPAVKLGVRRVFHRAVRKSVECVIDRRLIVSNGCKLIESFPGSVVQLLLACIWGFVDPRLRY